MDARSIHDALRTCMYVYMCMLRVFFDCQGMKENEAQREGNLTRLNRVYIYDVPSIDKNFTTQIIKKNSRKHP